MYRKAVLIYNPAAGRRFWRRALRIEAALDVLREQIESVDARPTGAPGSATELAGQACLDGADLVLACGGDGTINEVLNGMIGSPAHLGALPAGTANVFAMETGLPTDPVQAARMLPQLEARRVSLGRVRCEGQSASWRYFLLMGGAGLDAQIVYDLNLRLKSHWGILAYWTAALGRLTRRPGPFQVQADGNRYECTFALASKSSEYGGRLRIAVRAHLLADDFEVVLFHTRSSWRYVAHLASLAMGALERSRDITFLKARRLELSAPAGPQVHVQVDGEYVGKLPAVIETAPDALTLLIPSRYVKAHG